MSVLGLGLANDKHRPSTYNHDHVFRVGLKVRIVALKIVSNISSDQFFSYGVSTLDDLP